MVAASHRQIRGRSKYESQNFVRSAIPAALIGSNKIEYGFSFRALYPSYKAGALRIEAAFLCSLAYVHYAG
jgi:hypothetical protein